MAILRESFLKVEKTPYVHKLNHYTCENCGTKGSVYLHYNINGSIVMNSIKPAVVSDERSLCDQCGKEHLGPHFPIYIQEQFDEVHNEQKRIYDDNPNSLKRLGKRYVILMSIFLAIMGGYVIHRKYTLSENDKIFLNERREAITNKAPNELIIMETDDHSQSNPMYTSWMITKTTPDSMYFRELKAPVRGYGNAQSSKDPAMYSDEVFGMAKEDLYEMIDTFKIIQ